MSKRSKPSSGVGKRKKMGKKAKLVEGVQYARAHNAGVAAASGAAAKFHVRGGPGQIIKTKDTIFSGLYTAGTYTPDTEPCQKLPINVNGGAVQALNLLSVNNGEAGRLTNKIAMKSVRIKLNVFPTGIAGGTANVVYPVRVCLFYYRNANGAAYPNFFSIMQRINSQNVIANGQMYDSLSPSHFDDTVILKDEIWTMPGHTTAGGFNSGYMGDDGKLGIDWYVKLKDLETTYNGSANPPTIGQIQSGALMLAVVSDGNHVQNVADTLEFEGAVRLRFKDC